MVGSIYTMHILGMEGMTTGMGVRAFFGAVEAQTAGFGASEISIVSLNIQNQALFGLGTIAARYGYSFSQLSSSAISLVKSLPW
jgi:hypothetical protein